MMFMIILSNEDVPRKYLILVNVTKCLNYGSMISNIVPSNHANFTFMRVIHIR